MLSYMRKNAGSWIIKVLFGIIIIVFVFFYGFSDVRKKEHTIVASVGDHKITMEAYRTAYKNMVQMYSSLYRDQLTDETLEQLGLKQKALDQLITRELLLMEARQRDITVSPEDVRKAIINADMFQEQGAFSKRRYETLLKYYGITAQDYERDKQNELIISLLRSMITGAVTVSDRELFELYRMQNQTVELEYISFDPEETAETSSVTEQETTQYYEQNKETFRVPEQVKVSYIVFDPEQFARRVEVTEEEIKEYYDSLSYEFHEPKKVRARHILLKLDENATDEKEKKVREKALELRDEITQHGKSFSELAKKYSEDSATAENGGDLGFFKRGDMVGAFEKVAFSQEPGTVSQPVRTPYGYHLIKVEEINPARTKPLSDVTEEIADRIKKEKARDRVRREARRAFNRLFKSGELEQYAEKNDLELIRTGFFSYGKGPEDTSQNKTFSKEAFALAAGELAPAFTLGQKYILMKQEQRNPSEIPPIEQVKTAVVSELKKQKRSEAARRKAVDIIESIRSGNMSWEEVSESYSREARKASAKRMGDYIEGLGSVTELKEAAFDSEPPRILEKAFDTKHGITIVYVTGKTEPSRIDFEKERDSFRKTVLQRKKQERFSRFVQELKKEKETWVNNKLFSAI